MRLVAAYAKRTRRPTWSSAAAVRDLMTRSRHSEPVPHELYQVNHIVKETVTVAASSRGTASDGGTSAQYAVYSVVPATDAPRDTPLDICIYLHGGGYVNGLDARHWEFISELAAGGLKVVVPDYGLAPQHDAADARELLDLVYDRCARDAAATGHRMIIAGDSAGAGLALGWLLTGSTQGAVPVDRVALISPWLDVTCSTPGLDDLVDGDPWLHPAGLREAGLAWAGDLGVDDPLVSPLRASDDRLRSLPPVAVWTGTRDILHADAMALTRRLDSSTTSDRGDDVIRTVTGAVHNYPLTQTPEGRAARTDIVDRLSRWDATGIS